AAAAREVRIALGVRRAVVVVVRARVGAAADRGQDAGDDGDRRQPPPPDDHVRGARSGSVTDGEASISRPTPRSARSPAPPRAWLEAARPARVGRIDSALAANGSYARISTIRAATE